MWHRAVRDTTTSKSWRHTRQGGTGRHLDQLPSRQRVRSPATRAGWRAERRRGVAGGLACGASMKIASTGGGGAGWRRRTPRSGREVGIVRDAPARRSGGVAWRARRRRTACDGAAEAENSRDPQASRVDERFSSATSARDWVPRGGSSSATRAQLLVKVPRLGTLTRTSSRGHNRTFRESRS